MKFSSTGPMPSNFSEIAAALRAARFKAQSEEGDEDDKDIKKRKSATDIVDGDEDEDDEKKRKAKKAKVVGDDKDEDEDDGDEKRKDAASAEFVQRFLLAGQKRRDLSSRRSPLTPLPAQS